MLSISNLSAHYGQIRALNDVSLNVDHGELVALVGPNGAGKTTLMRTISGVQDASAGTILFDGQDITKLSPSERVRQGIAQVPEGRQVFAPMSVEDNLLLGGFTRTRAESGEGIEQAYSMFPRLKERRTQQAGTLSGGEQQMLAMSRALMAKPRLLLLDEPSMGLSPLLVDETFDTIVRLRATGTTIFVVEQNAYKALSIADRGYVMETGRTVLEDAGLALLDNDAVKASYLGV
ncbi:MAG: ABC transporter ATP-binding protein [Rhodospirillales bacterium]|jgi:branched-chain amino acid transport system ATP-binding protein|nr:ABC transporter ATP-binding protein [Rhodospirillales bacterium]